MTEDTYATNQIMQTRAAVLQLAAQICKSNRAEDVVAAYNTLMEAIKKN